jgi:tetratricopeptide (TPR) repeat protein
VGKYGPEGRADDALPRGENGSSLIAFAAVLCRYDDNCRKMEEACMRMKKLILAGVLGALVAVPAAAQTSEKHQAMSRQLVVQATAAMKAEKADDARLLYERALVANPANVEALIGLGQAHEYQGAVGRGLKYYRQALEIEPNDQGALEKQALAFLKRDMADRAEDNRDKLARLCLKGCDALSSVTTAIDEYNAQQADAGLAQGGG